MEFSLDKRELDNSLLQLQLEQPSTIEQWGESFEHVVEHALAHRNPPQQLPHSYRGRCKQPKLVKSPMMSPVRKASNGDFNPSCEVVTMASRRKVKQLRRLQSLCQRIQKFEKQGPTTIRTHHEIVQEWLVILQCKAFGFDFLSWAQYCCNLPPPSCPFPSHDWIFALCQFVKFLVEADLAQDEKIFKTGS